MIVMMPMIMKTGNDEISILEFGYNFLTRICISIYIMHIISFYIYIILFYIYVILMSFSYCKENIFTLQEDSFASLSPG